MMFFSRCWVDANPSPSRRRFAVPPVYERLAVHPIRFRHTREFKISWVQNPGASRVVARPSANTSASENTKAAMASVINRNQSDTNVELKSDFLDISASAKTPRKT